jgi:hypothetical protein
MITINFTGNINNDSLQIGDLAYFVTPSSSGGFEQSTDDPTFIGPITNIANNSINVNDLSPGGTIPQASDFVMFAKDSSINLSGIVGYYTEVKIINNSTEKAEMFSIASEVTPSSK